MAILLLADFDASALRCCAKNKSIESAQRKAP